MNSILRTNMHKIKWEFRYINSAIDYTIRVEKLAKIIKYVFVCKGVELSTDNCFLSIRLSFKPIWVNQRKVKRQGKTLEEIFKVRLLNDGFMKWLYEKRTPDYFKHYEDKTNVENEWDNIRKIYY
jgi:hypothetical protein